MKYEDLVQILEDEKKSILSKQAPDLYSKVNEYIKELEAEDRKVTRKRSIEAEMIRDELKNAFSNIDKLFKMRIRKVIKMASGKAFSKDPSSIDRDIENMTSEEKKVYNQVLDSILTAKSNTIEPILGADIDNTTEVMSPVVPIQTGDAIHSAPHIIETPNVSKDQVNISEVTTAAPIHEPLDTDIWEAARSEESGKKDLNKEYIVVRILKDIPTFIGTDGRNYALGAQDVAVLPKVNSKALIKRKVAIQIESK